MESIPESCLRQLVDRRRQRAPEAVALVAQERHVSFAELERRASGLAELLRRSGVGPESIAGVCLERSVELVVALLGVLEAGAAYLPLDPEDPEARLAYLVADARPRVIVTDAKLCRNFSDYAGDVFFVGQAAPAGRGSAGAACPTLGAPASCRLSSRRDESAGAACPTRELVGPENLAYVVYTSGSTGRPKGTSITHGALVNLLAAMAGVLHLDDRDAILQKTAIGFDAAGWEVWAALTSGARLVLAAPGAHRDPARLAEATARHRITVLQVVPSVLEALVDEPVFMRCDGLRQVVCAGEPLERDLRDRFYARLPTTALLNAYGPTEATINATFTDARAASSGRTVSIGHAIRNTRLHVLEPDLQPAVSGILYLAGVGLARGYLGRPAVTATKFVPDPFAETGRRLYDTGDRVRRCGDGGLEFLGRVDHQVKLRGARVELGEVESILRLHPGVEQAIAMVRDAPGGSGHHRDPRLVAYLVAEALEVSDLRAFLHRQAPEQMIPAVFVVLDELPRTPSGKPDRQALPDPWERRPYEPPRTPLEQRLAAIWCDVLELERVGIDEVFTELGGDSLLGARVVNRVQEAIGETVYVSALFEAPTVGQLAAYLEKHYGQARVGERRVDRSAVSRFRSLMRSSGTPGSDNHRTMAPAPPVFVLAPPRSGSTLLRVMLGGHPGLFAPPELELLGFDTLERRRRALTGGRAYLREGAVRALMEAEDLPVEQARLLMASYEERGSSVRQFYAHLTEKLGGRVLVDKSTTYALKPEVLRHAETHFPEARYLHLVRHPCGVIHSYCEARMDRLFHAGHDFSPRQLAELEWLAAHENVGYFLNGVDPHRRHRVDFEALVEQPEAVMREVCDFLGIHFVPEMADPYARPGHRMADGLYPESRPLGDSKLLRHGRLAPEVAGRWRGHVDPRSLGDPTRRLARDLGLGDVPVPEAPAAGVTSSGGRHPLSFAQQGIWFHEQLRHGGEDYQVAAAWQLEGTLDHAALAQSLRRLIQRHEALRTTFPTIEGHPVQLVGALTLSSVMLPAVDLRALPPSLRKETAHNLIRSGTPSSRGPELGPLAVFLSIRLAEQEHVFSVKVHHIVFDAWSLAVVVRELGFLYAGKTLPELPVRYTDFARWQRERLEDGAFAVHLDYWRRRLEGLEPLRLPCDRPRGRVRRGALHTVPWPDRTWRAVADLGRQAGASLFVTWLALFMSWLHRMSAQRDVVVGSAVAERHHRDLEGVVGLFVNLLVVRCEIGHGSSFSDVHERLREGVLEAYAHQELPFEKLVEALRPDRNSGRHPLFQVAFDVARPMPALELEGLETQSFDVPTGKARFDLEVFVPAAPGDGVFLYDAGLFDATTAERWARSFRTWVDAAVLRPDADLGRLTVLGAAQRHQLLTEDNDTRLDSLNPCRMEEAIEAQAVRTPDSIAVASARDEHLSYSALDRRAERSARALLKAGIAQEGRVAIRTERSPELIVGILAVLKAGGAYVPVDPAWPEERQRRIVTECQAECPAPESDAARDPEPGGRLTLAQGVNPGWAPGETARTLGNLAYVMYTSGSTGRPKGVMVEHRSLINHTASAGRGYRIAPRDRVFQFASPSFDASAEEIFPTLARGATLVLRETGPIAAPDELLATLERRRVTVLSLPTAYWHEWVASSEGDLPHSLRLVIIGGEQMSAERLRDWERLVARRRDVRLVNTYGPTEGTIVATRWDSSAPAEVSIGRPIDNATVYVVNPHFEPVPMGVPGELLIGGVGVARGYLGEAGRTARRFVPDPFGHTLGARLYRTGDLTRRRPGQDLVFYGRLDRQVKVRGFRVEPGEIEASLLRQPGVSDAVVDVRDEEPQLVAYVVGSNGSLSESSLSERLREILPEYMVPSVVTFLEDLPRTSAGKVDKVALRCTELSRPTATWGALRPRDDAERKVSAIWCEVLGLAEVGVEDNFFDLGGHSMLLIRLRSRLRAVLKCELAIAELFRYPTVAAMARRLDGPTPPAETGYGSQRLHRRSHVAELRRSRRAVRRPRRLTGG